MTSPVKRYNMDADNFFGKVRAYESEHGRWVKRDDYVRLERECEKLRETIHQLSTLDIRGHNLQDRLQFSTDGRALLDRINSALQAKP